jgi:protein O-GlcNAc transferase
MHVIATFGPSMTPNSTPEQLFQEALGHHREGRLLEAARLYEKALKTRPDFFDALHMLGVICYQNGRSQKALELISQAIQLRPHIPQAHNNLGNALVVDGRLREAVAAYERAVQLKPDYAEAYYNAGCALAQLEDFALAVSCYTKALEIEPRYIPAYTNRGLALERMKQPEAAVENYRAALQVDPQNVELRYKLGHTYFELRDLPAAFQEYLRIKTERPDMRYVHGHLFHTKIQMCDWTDWERSAATLNDLIAAGNRQAIHPFHALNFLDNPAIQRRLAEDWVAENHFQVLPRPIAPLPQGKIRVGFFSADLHIHPVSQLLLEFLETHDRDRFEFIAFSFLNSEDEMQARLKKAFARFIDVESMGDASVAKLAREMNLHLAIDLGGYTDGGRMDIFAQRAAPVQVSFLGYPATTGGAFMDFIIADPQVIPPDAEVHYIEKVVRLPTSLLPRDTRVRPSGKPFTRAEFDLPENGMVYCCFNNHVKFTPEVHALWMRVLKEVPGSVMWLATPPDLVRSHLIEATKRAGVDTKRLVFAARMDRIEDHLQRLTLADLFLDTWPYNAHTTASDALFVGLPVLTKMGHAFASRVAGSLLTTMGLTELITPSPEDFVLQAIQLGRDTDARQKLRAKTEEQRWASPLFDAVAYRQALSDLLADLAMKRPVDGSLLPV